MINDDHDNGDNNVKGDHDGSIADGDAAREIKSSAWYLAIDVQEQNIIRFFGNFTVCVNWKNLINNVS